MMDHPHYVNNVIILVVLVQVQLNNVSLVQLLHLEYLIKIQKHVNVHLDIKILSIFQYVWFVPLHVINVELLLINAQLVILTLSVTEQS